MNLCIGLKTETNYLNEIQPDVLRTDPELICCTIVSYQIVDLCLKLGSNVRQKKVTKAFYQVKKLVIISGTAEFQLS